MTRTAPATARLRLLGTSDVHVHLMDYDYYADRPDPDCGLALAGTLIAQARAEVPDCLLFDNGDFLQGNPLGDFVAQRRMRDEGQPHPAIRAMNALGYDAATLGNHEFNYGLEVLETALAAAEFPVVSANILRRPGADPAQDQGFRPPWVLLRRELTCSDGQRRPITVGVIGFAPPQIVQWDRLLLEGILHMRGIVEAARAHVPRLRAAGADVVVALSHSGLDALDEDPMAEHATAALARVPGIDAIFAGHSHLAFPTPGFAGTPGLDPRRGTAFGVPVAMPGFNAAHLGVIDLTLGQTPQGRWQVTDGQAMLRPVRGALPCPAVQQAVAADHAETLRHARAIVGETPVALHSYFALIEPSQSLQIVAEAQLSHLRQQLHGRPEAALPLLSAVSPFRAGGRGGPDNYISIPAGPLARRNTADLYIYPNTIAALRITGAELIDWLENSVGLYRQIRPGLPDQPLIDPEFPSYNHDRILGLSFAVDLAQPPRFDRFGRLINPGARRVVNLCHAGRPIDPGAEFVLATNNYRAAGNGGYAVDPARRIEIGRKPLREVLLRHVSDHAGQHRACARDFGFCPMPGASVLFDTAPAAAAFLPDIAHFRPQPLGLTAQGFARLRLHL